MAPAALVSTYTPPPVSGPKTKKATRPAKKLPQSLIEGAKIPQKRTFDPSEHLVYEPPEKIHKMADFGLEKAGISPNAISEPFRLFTAEAIRQMRAEIFSEPVLKDCQYASDFCASMVRGMGHKRAPFTYDVWKSPELLSKISAIAGIDLIPAFDFEIANINIAIKDDEPPSSQASNSSTKPPGDDDTPAFAWHYDSFPFVCVVMLSDCTGMVGGETAIRLPNGTIKKVRGPAQGYAVVMQGRYLEHQALKALGGRERITMVTPFRPKDADVRDEILLTGTRGISNLEEMYPQYFEYRMEVLEERVRAQRKREREREVTGRPFNVEETRKWVKEQRDFLDSILNDMIVVE
ncbi:uncharacterized protein AKAW2_60914S [Aspergillus luchuensis]|uniref:Similar to An12g05240 n=1 Tax=Aspergillus kawachii TaxID=1069201 RepID=A0A146FXJ3_ASPKA|nr:uncharacterized protein AKAW2_60914S [Aspergillus luchuensis]BCS02650.1 hypothetical protein AKAW2_60914S [Aspergillus luchuensis]BCS14317.1 hypothetical protein ALUC_60873S [Aspergillus luchuensis]GAA86530.1 similar to An12g05240 [Aspergillus luchuensis IFO 4308]GAT30175.1 similar to An12g05240 [Aspergillus luchuensis]